MLRKKLLPVWLVLAATLSAMAGTTGKITGRVIDAATRESVPGVNIMVEGTTQGAVTNLNGDYVVLQVPPGTYTLRFKMLGYTELRVQSVRVEIDLTTRADAALTSMALSTDDVVVVAERPIVSKDVSNSQMNIDTQVVETMPIQTVKEALTLQAGIERSADGIVVRGGGVNQTVFMLDGLSLNDERANIPYLAAGLSAVKEIQVQTGGFNAEYGNLRSGLVNVVTREGEVTRYAGALSFRYRPAGPKQDGPSLYDRNSYFNRPFLDDAVCWTGTNNGAWDSYTQRQYFSFGGWNAISDATVRDKNPNNDLTPAGAQKLFEWQHRRQGDIDKPDYVFDAGFGGPVPLVGKKLGRLRFFASHFRQRDMFVFPLSRDSYSENQTQVKINSDLTSQMKLTVSGLYGEVRSVSPQSEWNWKVPPTGRVLRDAYDVADLLTASTGASLLYMPDYCSPSDIFRYMAGVQLTHLLSSRTFYEVSLQNSVNRYHTFQSALRDTARVYEPVPGYRVDEAPWGYWGYKVDGIDGRTGLGGWMNLDRDQSVNSTTRIRFDLTSQIDLRNQIKVGADYAYNDYDIKTSFVNPSMTTWNLNMNYRVFPYRIGTYIQDKLEFQGFVANLGLRYDYSNSNTDYFTLADYDKSFKAGYGNEIEETAPKVVSKASSYWSPRLGISHPISENSKLYFNYGHFRSEPASLYRFQLQREYNGLVTYVGNPNLELEKTVAYELGYSQNLLDRFLFNLAAYYKDVSNQPGWISYRNVNNTVQYAKAANNNYQDIRGFEVTLTKRSGAWWTGFVNYTYDVRTSGYFGLLYYFQDPTKQRDYLRQNPYQEKPHPRPYFRTNIELHTPHQFGPSWRNLRPLEEWSLNIIADWKAGAFDTYNPNNIPGIQDNVQWADWYNVNLRLSRQLRLKGVTLQLYADANNIFNFKFLSSAGFSDTYDRQDYLASLHFSWETGDQKGNDRVGTFRPAGVAFEPLEANPDNDPAIRARNDRRLENKSYIDMPNFTSLTFLNPRDVLFGVRVNF